METASWISELAKARKELASAKDAYMAERGINAWSLSQEEWDEWYDRQPQTRLIRYLEWSIAIYAELKSRLARDYSSASVCTCVESAIFGKSLAVAFEEAGYDLSLSEAAAWGDRRISVRLKQ
jgi:hypothetical protein